MERYQAGEQTASAPLRGETSKPANQPASDSVTAAVFDVDNTLLPGTSCERLFIRFLIAHRQLGLGAAYGTALVLLRHLGRAGPRAVLREQRPYLRGWQVERLAALAEEAFATAIAPRLSRRAVERVRRHQAAGHLVALLSGAPPFLLAPLGRHLGIDRVIGTPLAIVDDAYTGGLAGAHLYGPEKAALTVRFAREEGVDLGASFGYADHHSDAPFLLLFGQAVCVNPTRRLRRLAARFGWVVEEFR